MTYEAKIPRPSFLVCPPTSRGWADELGCSLCGTRTRGGRRDCTGMARIHTQRWKWAAPAVSSHILLADPSSQPRTQFLLQCSLRVWVFSAVLPPGVLLVKSLSAESSPLVCVACHQAQVVGLVPRGEAELVPEECQHGPKRQWPHVMPVQSLQAMDDSLSSTNGSKTLGVLEEFRGIWG